MTTAPAFLPEDVLSALQGFNDDYSKLEASTGSVERPPAGEWNNRLTKIDVTTKDTHIKLADGQKIPAFRVEFSYQTLDPQPPNLTKVPLTWPGKVFILPSAGLSSIPHDGKRKQAEISGRRLKGHLQGILGAEATGNTATDLQKAITKLAGEQVVALRVKCQYDSQGEGENKRIYFEEFVLKNLAA